MLNPKIIQKLIPHMSIVNWPRTAKLLDDYSRTEHVPLNISSPLPLIKNEESSKFIPLLCLQIILLLSIGFWSFLNHHIFLSMNGNIFKDWSKLIHSRHSTAQFSKGGQKWYFKIDILISINGALSLHLSTVYFSHLSYIRDQLRKCIHI